MSADDDLLARLGYALAPPPVEPSPEGVRRLRSQVSGPGRVASAPRARRPRVAVAAIVAGCLAGTAAGLAAPDPLRAAAHSVFPSVHSPRLLECIGVLYELGEALDAQDAPEVAIADQRMHELVASLDLAEREQMEPVAHQLHLRAVAFLDSVPESATD